MNMNNRLTKARKTRTTRNKSITSIQTPIYSSSNSVRVQAKLHTSRYHHCIIIKIYVPHAFQQSVSLRWFELHVKRGSHDPRWTWKEFGTRRGWEPLLDANGTCKAWKLWPHQELHACRNSFWIIQEYSRIKAESNTLPWHDASKLL